MLSRVREYLYDFVLNFFIVYYLPVAWLKVTATSSLVMSYEDYVRELESEYR